MAIKLFWWTGMPNFGDALNPLLCEKLFHQKTQWASPETCEAFFVGSLLDALLYPCTIPRFRLRRSFYQNPVKIWSTGFIQAPNTRFRRRLRLPEIFFRPVEVFAVRGKLTLERVKNITKKPLKNVVLGDAGLLAEKLIDANPITKKYKIGFIPHHTEIHGFNLRPDFAGGGVDGLFPKDFPLEIPIYQALQQRIENAVVIDFEADPLAVLMRIAECETICSSALHGLIVADSLGIPNMWSTASERLLGGEYKFHDYYSVFGTAPRPLLLHEPLLPHAEKLPEWITKNYAVDRQNVEKIQQDLMDSFPF